MCVSALVVSTAGRTWGSVMLWLCTRAQSQGLRIVGWRHAVVSVRSGKCYYVGGDEGT